MYLIFFFTEIGLKLYSQLPHSDKCPLTWMPPARSNSFYLTQVTERECLGYVRNLRTTKSSLDEIPVNIFKQICPFLITPLVKIINLCFKNSIFPDCLKIGRVIQIFKSGNKTDPSNYRPISTLPYISKIFEMCLSVRLVDYFEKFSLLTEFQFGFRRKRSTADAVLQYCNIVYNSFENKKILGSIYVDYKKAFDVVSHKILFDKLHNYGIRGAQLELLRNYLKNRKQYVNIGSNNSSLRNVKIGLLQGSCLGPFFFLIFINDLPNVSPVLHYTLFADDTTLSLTDSNFSSLTSNLTYEIEKIIDWATANRLTINASKTNIIFFSYIKFPLTDSSTTLSNQNSTSVSSCKIWEFLSTII